ncbi:SusC/RagA family TonB-linked outer membrane protein [Gemmatimonadota bacterium DH-20]|uniref:SusC/RagA family TonB-linked outer membrane protein n=2 Tax=Gaopeijia maritima TaxID=3119007 RepID=A0ABU9E5Q7_9BACT
MLSSMIRPRAWVLGLAFAVIAAPSLTAQETGQVTGQVTAAATMQPLTGAQVFVSGLRLGALTNEQGRYVILNVPAGTHTVRVDIIGYTSLEETVTVTAGGTTTTNFSLEQTAVALEEIVVTGTAAEVRAREVGNALDAVTSRDIENLPVTNPENIIGGRIPGVTVVPPGGQPGTGGTIRIRGQNTASQAPEPLVYIDGVRVYNQPVSLGTASRAAVTALQDINAEDIERVEVIKGASATTLYGTEAAGGVIQIFTKRGVAGSPIWNAELGVGLARMGKVGSDADPTDIFTRCGDPDLLFGLSQSSSSRGERVFFEDPTCPSSGRWFEDGMSNSVSLSVRGGSETVSYFVSSNYSDADGTLPTQNSKDGGFRANMDFRPIDDLSIALNTAYTRRNSRFVEDGNNANGFLLNVGRGTNGNFKGGKGEDCVGVDVLCVSNGYLFDSENTAVSDRYTTGLVLQYEPIDGFSNRFAVGWDYLSVTSEEWEPFGHLRNPGGYYSSSGQAREKLSLDYAGSLRNGFGESIVSTFSWGGQIFRDRARYKFVSTQDFAGPGKPTLTSGGGSTGVSDSQVATTTAGFFLQEVLGFNDQFFVTGGLRVDGNSAFGDDFGLQFYPKVSTSYIVSDHEFWPSDWFDTFKLRAAIGESGKAPGAFDKLRTWSPVTGDEGSAGFTPNDIGNNEVGPERTREFEVGFDASFLRGRFGIEATYYNTRTSDALVPVAYPPSLGFLASRTENVGEIKGSGTEFQLTASLLQTESFEWRVQGNFGFNTNEAVDLAGQELSVDNLAGIREGDPVPSYYGNKIMNPDAFEDPDVESDQLYGAVNPTRVIGLNSTLSLGQSLTVDVLFEHQGGHYLPNYTGYQNGRRGAWYPCYEIQDKIFAAAAGDPGALDDVTALERGKCATNAFGGYNSAFWIESADFWKWRSLAVTYQLPSDLVASFASRASVTFAGTNLLTWTDYSGADPEVEDFYDRSEGGIYDGLTDYGRREYYNIPAPRSFLLSLRVTF